MIDFFLGIINAFYDSLPGSFIQNAEFLGNDNLQLISDLLNYLNWFIPFDIASNIMAVWLPCFIILQAVRGQSLRNCSAYLWIKFKSSDV